ncbi:MAG: hypothetical protein HPY53_00430 [Brevinematales bacterium]|nr:hypothetical protein [Brevinematales bacterium]
MAVESQILISNYGVTEEFANNLLLFTKNDVEGAIRILEAAERDVVVLKAKFISSKKLVYGAVVLFYNFQFNIPQYVFCALSGDINLSRIRIETDWRDYLQEITRYMEGKEAEFELASRIEGEILSPENVPYITSSFIDKKNYDMVNLKRFLLNCISKVLLDNQIVFKLSAGDIDVFKFNTFLSNTKVGLKIIPKQGIKEVMMVNLRIDPVLAPIGGTDIERVYVGDEILVKIMDDRDIARYIADLIGGRDDSGIPRAVWGRVANNQKSQETGNNLLNLQFGPGLFGTFSIGSKVRVQLKERENRPEQLPKQAGEGNAGLDEEAMKQIREIGTMTEGQKNTDTVGMYSQKPTDTAAKQKKDKSANLYKVISLVVMVLAIVIILILVIFGT